MASIETPICSEKEEQQLKTEGNLEPIEEVPPGSSPEGVFQHEPLLENIDNIPQDNNVEQIEHHIIENVHENGQMLAEPDSIVITQEDLYEAGLEVDNLDNLTDEQISMLIAISEQRMAKQVEVIETEIVENDPPHDLIAQDIGHEDIVPNENSVAIILTDDGGLKVTDHAHQDIYFSPQQLEELNINVNNLTEENVQHLVQIAMPSISIKQDEMPQEKEQEQDEGGPSTSYQSEKPTQQSLIGQTVHVRMADNRIQSAIVRYVRGNLDYKIQFMDGEFAYATPDQIIIPRRSRNQYQQQQQQQSQPQQHQPQHQHQHQQQQQLQNHHRRVRCTAPKRMLAGADEMSGGGTRRDQINNDDDDSMTPPVLKRSYHMATIIEPSHVHQSPNFCCPICDKKVYQKEPSYIVIRLPACDSCTREKIIVLDDQNQ